MKQNLWIWALAALSMTACTSEDVPSQDQVVTENDFESPDGRVVVQLGAESSASVGISRAPIEGVNIVALQDLGIFALNRNEGVKFTEKDLEKDQVTNKFGWLTNDNSLLVNVKAKGKEAIVGAGFDKDKYENNTVAPLDSMVNTGRRITLYKADDDSETGVGAVYYYPMQGGQN